MQLRRAYGEAEAALEEWLLEEFTSSVQTYKECGEEAIQPIIQQLNAAARHHDVEMRERGLKILQALLEALPPTLTLTPTLTVTLAAGAARGGPLHASGAQRHGSDSRHAPGALVSRGHHPCHALRPVVITPPSCTRR